MKLKDLTTDHIAIMLNAFASCRKAMQGLEHTDKIEVLITEMISVLKHEIK